MLADFAANPYLRIAVTSEEIRGDDSLGGAATLSYAERIRYRLLTGNRHPEPDPVKQWDVTNLREIAARFPLDAHILDCGAFNSPAARWLAENNFSNVHAIDLNPNLLHFRWATRVKCSVQDIQCTAFTDESFDLVYCASTIEHGVDWGNFLSEAQRILRPGGTLYISTDIVRDEVEPSGFQAFGLPWNPLTQSGVREKIDALPAFGFAKPDHYVIPTDLDALPLRFGSVPHGFVAIVTTRN